MYSANHPFFLQVQNLIHFNKFIHFIFVPINIYIIRNNALFLQTNCVTDVYDS
ncbi:hypothetical protein Syun_005655 [Stephania yunnanensis]|uniref:Uncharacterized protein n=1 Tax=Stephania yunnanensis TaxID=152371 RepID=A0AAP0Q2G8_9MAGN